MPSEVHEILSGIALFVLGTVLGFVWQREQHLREVADWKAIARQASVLNRLVDRLAEQRDERVNHGD